LLRSCPTPALMLQSGHGLLFPSLPLPRLPSSFLSTMCTLATARAMTGVEATGTPEEGYGGTVVFFLRGFLNLSPWPGCKLVEKVGRLRLGSEEDSVGCVKRDWAAALLESKARLRCLCREPVCVALLVSRARLRP